MIAPSPDARIGWVAPDLARVAGWTPWVEGLVAAVGDAGGLAEAAPLPVFVPELPPDAPRGAAALLEHRGVVEWLRARGAARIAVFKPSHRIEVLASRAGLGVLAAPARVAQRLENKLVQAALLREAGVPVVPGAELPRGLPEPGALGDWGWPRVVQRARGHSGASTWLVRDADEWEDLRTQLSARAVRVAPFIEGTTWTLNAVVDAAGACTWGRPYEQLTGWPELTPHALGACGNRWTPALDIDTRSLRALVARIGAVLARQGYVGVFGVDILAARASGRLLVVEVNPRITSGLAMEGWLYRGTGRRPPLAGHVRVQLGERLDGNARASEGAPLQGTQLVLYASSAEVRLVESAPASGTFRLDDRGVLARQGDGVDPTACRDDEAVVWFPGAGRRVRPGAELARVQSSQVLGRARAIEWARAVRRAVSYSTGAPLPAGSGSRA